MLNQAERQSIKEGLLRSMAAYFGEDRKRIDHARKVTGHAEKLLEMEGGDHRVVIAAAVLHDIGIHEAERKHGSTNGKYQEIEGPPIARHILTDLGFAPNEIEEVCGIIGHHHSPGKITTRNFAILYDADWLVNLRDEYDIRDQYKLAEIIEKVFLTESGKALARTSYLSQGTATRVNKPSG